MASRTALVEPRAFNAASSVKNAESPGDEPYTDPVDFNTTRLTRC